MDHRTKMLRRKNWKTIERGLRENGHGAECLTMIKVSVNRSVGI